MAGGYFADTFYWIAVINPRDAHHCMARDWERANPTANIVTTEEVLAEVLSWFSGMGPLSRATAAGVVRRTLAKPSIQVLPQTSTGFRDALALYETRLDKEYSLVDCRSMVAMRSRGLVDVLSNDHHFRQEGFAVVFS